MKNIFLFLCIGLLTSTAYAQTTYVPDDNFEAYLISRGWDFALDNSVLTSSINNVTNLNIPLLDIADLTGIEDFAALEELRVGSNLLTTLDVSQNLNLKILTCENNQLTNLNVAQLTALETLSCENNQLTSLDLSQLTALKNLYCRFNDLTNLDVSQSSLLESITCYDNNLTSLDLSQNPNLLIINCEVNQLESLNVQNGNNTNIALIQARNNINLSCIQVDDVAYSNANWSNIDNHSSFGLDCSILTFVPDDAFEQALIDLGHDAGPLNDYVPTNNIASLTSLNVNNKNITDLTGIEDFTSLTELYCSDNQLNTLDVSQNVALEAFHCNNNLLTSLDVSQNPALSTLNCFSNLLTSLDVSQNSSLDVFYCSFNQLTSLNVRNGNNTNISQFIASDNPNLICIEVDDVVYSTTNWLNIDPASSFSEDCNPDPVTLIPDTNFEQALIDLGIDSDGLINGQVFTSDISGISSLDVHSKSISDLTGIEDFTSLTNLTAYSNSISSIDVSNNTGLTVLNLAANNLNGLDVNVNTALATLSCANNNLSVLDVSNNTAIVSLFCYGNSISTLNLDTNVSLTFFDCNGNDLTNLDLSNNSNLTSINCANNDLSSLNVKNGNNTSITTFVALINPNLACIEVDDDAYSTTNWTNIDAQTSFSEDCSTPVTLIPDVNFEQALIDLNIDSDGLINGQVLTSDVSGLTSLDVSNKNINDLSGIEDFIDLIELRCHSNNLTSLNVANNTQLTILDCHANNLNALNIDLNVLLVELIAYTNSINTINVANNTNLEILNLGANNLNALSVVNNVLLRSLSCSGSNITTLDVSNNPLLEILACGANNLSSLDVSNNPVLSYFECDQNNLTSLNVNNNPDLSWFTCSSNDLSELNMKNTSNYPSMNFFNATSNPNLTCIEVNDVTYSTSNWTNIDPQTNFNEECNVTFTYNNGWLPEDPNGIVTTLDSIIIETGDVEINANINCESLTINPGASLTVNTGVTLSTVSGMTLESSSSSYSSLILDGTVVGEITYNRHVNINGSGSTGSNDLISAPLTGQAFNTFAASNPNILNNGTLYLFGPFEKNTGQYVNWTGTETATLDASVGYRTGTTNNGTLTFTGNAENGSVTNNIVNQGTNNEEWNLIGNPYPSYLNVQQFLLHDVGGVTNIQLFEASTAGIYGYDGNALNGWTIYNLANTTASTLIAPGQGFFVSADLTNAPLYDVEFSPEMRSTGSGDDFIVGRSSELVYLTLNLNAGDRAYKTEFYFNSNATEGLDIGYDAEVWGNSPTEFGVYSHLIQDNLGKAIALQTMHESSLEDAIIPLGVHANQGEQLRFSIAETTLPANANVYLEDVVANITTLLNNTDYVFIPNTDISGTGRFYLRYSNGTLSTIENPFKHLNIFILNSSKELVLNGQLNEETVLGLYDTQGRKVLTTTLDHSILENRIDISNMSAGVYVAIVENSNNRKTKKVIIK